MTNDLNHFIGLHRIDELHFPFASCVTCTWPTSPAAIFGLAMTLLPRPGEHVVAVVLDVPAELQPRRPRLREPPAFERARGHAQQHGYLSLGQERGLDLDACMSFHARQVRSAYPRERAGPSAYLISRDEGETRLSGVSGHQSGHQTPNRAIRRTEEGAGLPREL